MSEQKSTSAIRQQEVPAGLSEIEAQLERLSKFIADLEERLSTVTRPSEVKEGEPEKAPVRVPLAGKLFAFAKQIEISGSQIADIVQRMEL